MIWSLETDDFHGYCGEGKYPLLKVLSKNLNGSKLSFAKRQNASKFTLTVLLSFSRRSWRGHSHWPQVHDPNSHFGADGWTNYGRYKQTPSHWLNQDGCSHNWLTDDGDSQHASTYRQSWWEICLQSSGLLQGSKWSTKVPSVRRLWRQTERLWVWMRCWNALWRESSCLRLNEIGFAFN